MDFKAKDKEYIANTYNRFDLLLEKGEGVYAYDEAGQKYIDLGAGIAVNSFGYCDAEWQKAVINQIKTLQHTSNLYYTEPQIKLAELICQKTGMKKVFFANSGAEANECVIKGARKYSSDKYGGDRNLIITLVNSFHGRTITTLSATGQEVFHKHFGPFTEGFLYVPANDVEALVDAMNNPRVCGILMETIQGEGGINVLTEEFVKTAAKICDEKDILLLFDEVQTGNGRTGELYSYMHYGVTPDIFSTAKGLAGGLPLGAAIFGEKTKDVFSYGDHGATFGGNPVCAAGAYSIMSRITPELLREVTEKSKYIVETLTGAKNVVSISGRGLMLGIETTKPVAEVRIAAEKAGVLVLTAKNKIRLLPPLNITMADLKTAITKLKEVIEA